MYKKEKWTKIMLIYKLENYIITIWYIYKIQEKRCI